MQVGPESVGASEGFLGWIAYLGAANAGIPLSIIVKNYGWEVRRKHALLAWDHVQGAIWERSAGDAARAHCRLCGG